MPRESRLNFRQAQKSEKDAIMALYKSVVGRKFCVWNDEYPGIDEINLDMAQGNLFVLEDNINREIIGAISIVPENELDGFDFWHFRENVGEFARVVIAPKHQGKHLAKILVSDLLDEMKRRGYECVHISVATENIPALRTYKSLGFEMVGQSEMWGHEYYLGELKLKETIDKEIGMQLDSAPFLSFLRGEKTVELRLNDEKRRKIKTGDVIIFTRREKSEDKLEAEVVNIHKAGSFAELFERVSPKVCGFGEIGKRSACEAMRRYYSESGEEKYGVVGIEVKILRKH